MENKFSLSPEVMLGHLKSHSHDVIHFINLISDFYANYPITMINNNDVKQYILNSEWFNTPEAFVSTVKHIARHRGIQRHRLLRYIGLINTDEMFWFKLASIDITFAKYYNDATDAYKSYVAIME